MQCHKAIEIIGIFPINWTEKTAWRTDPVFSGRLRKSETFAGNRCSKPGLGERSELHLKTSKESLEVDSDFCPTAMPSLLAPRLAQEPKEIMKIMKKNNENNENPLFCFASSRQPWQQNEQPGEQRGETLWVQPSLCLCIFRLWNILPKLYI